MPGHKKISELTEKISIVDDDLMATVDLEALPIETKKTKFSTWKSTLKTYFDTVYRLATADHSHQSAGAQAGKLDHGLALNGLGDDDHPQYIKHSLATAVSDFLVASGAGVFIKKTLAEVRTLLNWAADIATHAALTTGVHGAGSKFLAYVRTAGQTQVVRATTLVIAANDTTALGKSQADEVCNATNDHIEIQDAIDALPV